MSENNERIPTMGDITDAQSVLVPLVRDLTPFDGAAGKSGKEMSNALQHVRDAMDCLNKASEKLEQRKQNVINGATIMNAEGDVVLSAEHPNLVKDERSDEKLLEVAENPNKNDNNENVDAILNEDKEKAENDRLEAQRLEAERLENDKAAKNNKKNNK